MEVPGDDRVPRSASPRELGFELITHTNPEGLANGINPFDHGSKNYTDIMKTQALKQALDTRRLRRRIRRRPARRGEVTGQGAGVQLPRQASTAGIPRTSVPSSGTSTTAGSPPASRIRVFPLSNWTELDIWQYVLLEDIEIVPLYYSQERPVVVRDGVTIMVDDDRFRFEDGENPEMRSVRFRTLGCYPLSGAVESMAATLPEIIQEMLLATRSEREGRVIDYDQSGSMEEKKREGYF